MDTTIGINKKALIADINRLKALKGKIDTAPVLSAPVENMQGEGEMISLINDINCIYKYIAEDYKSLLGNTIRFFENVLNSTTSADDKAERLFR